MQATIRRKGIALAVSVLLSLFAFSAEASAQLELPSGNTGSTAKPGKPKRSQTGTIAPHLTCTVCYERNYTTVIDYAAKNGLQNAWCLICRQPTLHSLPKKGAARGAGGGINLPSGATPAGGKTPGPSAVPRAPLPVQAVPRARPDGAANFIFDEVAKVKHIDDELALQAVDSLISLGEPGLAAARFALASTRAPVMMTSLRVLLRGGKAADADLVVARIRQRMPSKAAPTALNELIAKDPVRATPRLLVELLAHPQSPVRAVAQRTLANETDPSVLPLLVSALRSKTADTRLRAVELVLNIDDPAVLELLLERLDDSRAKVARRAVQGIAESHDPRVEVELLTRAFRERWILRSSAYAILAIVAREQQTLEPMLGAGHVDSLLRGLASKDPFIAGTCATALAGIGFRSSDPDVSLWLNSHVPDRLVGTVSGDIYFNDFSALQGPALQRLEQIAGVSYGANGPGWAGWWLVSRDRFRASRAVIAAPEGSEVELLVRFRDGGSAPTFFTLAGPAQAEALASDLSAARGELLFLSEAESRDFVALLRREQVLGTARLPGVRGAEPHKGRHLEIRIGDEGKTFVFGTDVTESWFERVTGMATSLRDRNRWQRYSNPDKDLSRHAFWKAQTPWWSGDHTDVERSRRLKRLVFERLRTLPLDQRSGGVEELSRLYSEPGVAASQDVSILMELLRAERLYVERAEGLVALLSQTIGAANSEDETAIALTRELCGVLIDNFSSRAAGRATELLESCGAESVRAAATDTRPLMRAIAAVALADGAVAEDEPFLLALLKDPIREVEVATILAVGEHRVEAARVDLLIRARMGPPEVREAALRAIGYLGGDRVLEAIISGLTDPQAEVKIAAAEGLAALGDPSTAPLLVSLLRQGKDAPTFEHVRRGLYQLGEDAWPQLMTAMRSPSANSQREAALILARQNVPESASTLIRLFTETPSDRFVATELAILSCVDFIGEADPSTQWWEWWDGVKHGDALSWFRGALDSQGMPPPPAADFAGEGSIDVVKFLLEVMRGSEAHLVERARRELTRMLGRDLGELPPRGLQRDVWLSTLLEVVQSTRE